MLLDAVLFSIGILIGNLVEYFVHRYLFHGLGKKKKSIFAFHLREHHIKSRANNFYDIKVSKNELLGLPFLLALSWPIYAAAPGIYFGMMAYAIAFFVLHNYQHSHPEFTKKYFPWHWDHHMNNQNKSWGVVLPLTDIVTGTLEKKS